MKVVYRQVKSEENEAQDQCAKLNNCACDEYLECYKKNIINATSEDRNG